MPLKGEILFVCVENAGRSQMAQAFAEKSGMKASSAGTVPSSRVNPVVVEAMRERGIDLSRRTPKILTADLISNARHNDGLLGRGGMSKADADVDAKEAGGLARG